MSAVVLFSSPRPSPKERVTERTTVANYSTVITYSIYIPAPSPLESPDSYREG